MVSHFTGRMIMGFLFSRSGNIAGGGGTVLTFTSVDRDTVSAAGGATLTLTVTGANTTPSVTLNGVSCTNVSVVNGTTITCVTPAVAVGGPYSMVCGGVTLNNCVTVLAAPTTIHASTDFEGGTIPAPFLHGASATISTAQAHSGTHSVICTASGNGTSSSVWVDQSDNLMIDVDYYIRWFILMPTATLTATANNGQIKMYLSRNLVGSGQPGWLMLGEGTEFNSNNNSFASRIDNSIIIIATTPPITPNVWHEIQVWQRFNSAAGQGSSKVWFDGKLQGSATSALMGTATVETYEQSIGIAYTQNAASYPLSMYIDDVKIANGFIDP